MELGTRVNTGLHMEGAEPTFRMRGQSARSGKLCKELRSPFTMLVIWVSTVVSSGCPMRTRMSDSEVSATP